MPDTLLVASSFLPGHGGIESYLAELTHRLRPRIAVLAEASRDGRPIPNDLGYETYGSPHKLRPDRPLVAEIIDITAGQGIKRVLFGSSWPLPLVGPQLERAGLRYAVIVHGAELIIPAALPLVRARLVRSLAGADVLFAASDHTADRVRSLLSGARFGTRVKRLPDIERLYPQVDLDRFSPDVETREVAGRLGLPADRRVILHLGRLVRRKGVRRLISALPEVQRSIPDAMVVVAGVGPELAHLRRLAAKRESDVKVLGSVEEGDVPALYALATAFALPVADRLGGLEFEGLGVVLLEAAACGTPSVTGRSGGTAEAVVDGETGYVIDGNDRSELVTALVRLLADPDSARAMGMAGRKHVNETFSAPVALSPLHDWLDAG